MSGATSSATGSAAGSRGSCTGVFTTLREAQERQRWIGGELAAHRVPDLRLTQPAEQVPLTDIADRYLATRIDATDRTLSTYPLA